MSSQSTESGSPPAVSDAGSAHVPVSKTSAPPPAVRLRLWPGVVIAVAALIVANVPGRIAPRSMVHFFSMMLGAPVAVLAMCIWWGFFSRLPWRDKWLICGLFVASCLVLALSFFPGMQLLFAISIGGPWILGAWALWLVVSRRWEWRLRRNVLALLIVAGWGVMALLRIEGTDGSMNAELAWRFSPTSEQVFLAQRETGSKLPTTGNSPATLSLRPGDWPEFRGSARDGQNSADRIGIDWEQRPPRELWRRRIGPGWGSCSIVDGRLFTQEQREEQEAVVCYDAVSGAELWEHVDRDRFTEVISGAGPRATPTFHDGRLFTYGALGRLNCLDAANGKVVWTVDTKSAGGRPPTWGMSSSPLVAGDQVIVYLGGSDNNGTAAFDRETGKLLWGAGEAQHGYSSAQRIQLGGVDQVLMQSEYGIESFAVSDGARLWQYEWTLRDLNRDVQPNLIDHDILITTGIGGDQGIKRLHVAPSADGWSVDVVWSTRSLRPYFNDFVVYQGHAYGFDQTIFCCVNLQDGRQTWKKGRYGSGQVLLLASQGLLVVQSETGDVALLRANPQEHQEIGRITALSAKTWNHPVIAHGRLYVRNAEELVCFALPDE